ncbi:hypothetical protein CVIRNUC_004709 [Coccomyxa viridis]|uniref:ELMO domain-containing protein n=1 Tax=Coccomyxa viridis TaxID=1274662 RepID=A0AAV1I6H8_9CHLO|nr:hypothetical protein CVIRNUC_004709 [Coccomyxa viridis]
MEGTVRRRKGQESDSGEMEEPLLGYAAGSASSSDSHHRSWGEQGGSRHEGSRALVPRSINRVDWEELWRVLWGGCRDSLAGILATLGSCLAPLLPFTFRPRQLTALQEERLQDLRERCRVLFDASKPQHMEALQRLWGVAFPGHAWEGLQADRWMDMGWQRNDPSSDFRGAGLIALQNHLFMAQEQPALFRRLLRKTEGERSEWEYPFAVAGINLTFMLQEVVGLRDRRVGTLVTDRLPASAPGQAFLQLLPQTAHAFEQVYCMAFQVLDREWLAVRASYMDFPGVMKKAERSMERALSSQPESLQQLQRLLEVT